MSNAFVIIKMCYVHNQWYDISCVTLYICRMNGMNKSGSKCNLPAEDGFLILIQEQVIQINIYSKYPNSDNTEFDNTCSLKKKTVLFQYVENITGWNQTDAR